MCNTTTSKHEAHMKQYDVAWDYAPGFAIAPGLSVYANIQSMPGCNRQGETPYHMVHM